MTTLPDLQDRLRGVAVGAAVGDALGMPLEFKPPSPASDLVRDFLPGRLPPGSFTDDTEMALALAESLLAHRPLDPDDLARRFVAWFQSGPPDVGIHTQRVLGRIAGGAGWRRASESAWKHDPANAGNGSVMRCWPVAVACWRNPAELRSASALQSGVTHFHPECVSGSVFVNEVIAGLLSGLSPEEAVKAALPTASFPAELVELIEQAPLLQRRELKNSGWVRHTLQSVVWGLLTTSSFEEAVVQVANLGSDADTAAAVVGAMAGAAYGLSGIPTRWQVGLTGEWPLNSGSRWDTQRLIDLADRLSL